MSALAFALGHPRGRHRDPGLFWVRSPRQRSQTPRCNQIGYSAIINLGANKPDKRSLTAELNFESRQCQPQPPPWLSLTITAVASYARRKSPMSHFAPIISDASIPRPDRENIFRGAPLRLQGNTIIRFQGNTITVDMARESECVPLSRAATRKLQYNLKI